jgi:hypothetical protein
MAQSKKTLFLFLSILLSLILVVILGSATYNYVIKEEPSVPVEQIQANLKTDDFCSDRNLEDLEIVYNNEGDASKKALYAEQLGTCYSVKQNYTDSKKWYALAGESYAEANNSDKVSSMESATANAEFLSTQEPLIQPDDATNLDYDVGQN